MNIRRITTEGLSHYSYFVSDGGEALVIDPRRDIDVYLELAMKDEAKIRWVFETHRHEDFAVGSCELASRTGATIHHGKAIPFAYGVGIGEGFECAVGRWRLQTLQTPGHTAESLTYTLSDRAFPDAPLLVFSGDALFVGEVGRIDLYGADCREHLAGALHDSLFEKILPLGDGVILAPAHGGGSVCGANISPRSESTLGFERLHNPRLIPDREHFIKEKSKERLVVPRYFRRMEEYNLQGPPLLGHLPRLEPLSSERFAAEIREGALVVDTRLPQGFAGGHIPGSYSIWLEGLPSYAGWVLPLDHPLLLVLEPGTSSERVARMLVRVGYENFRGVLRGGFESWQNAGKPWERIPTLGPKEARERLERGAVLVDVRNVEEWSEGVIAGSILLTSAELENRLDEIPRGPVIVTCSVGHRGSIGASILQRHGFEVSNLLGGTRAWQALGYPLVQGPEETRISGISMVTDNSAVGSEIHKAGY